MPLVTEEMIVVLSDMPVGVLEPLSMFLFPGDEVPATFLQRRLLH